MYELVYYEKLNSFYILNPQNLNKVFHNIETQTIMKKYAKLSDKN